MCGNNVKFVVEQPETVNQKTIRSVEQVMMDAQGRNCLKILYLCAVFLLKRDAPAIELISIAKKNEYCSACTDILPDPRLIIVLPWHKAEPVSVKVVWYLVL